jgi:cyclase
MQAILNRTNPTDARRRAIVTLAGFLFTAIPALAQVDFSGEWSPRFHEDQPERVPGPELGDYLGLPINTAARMRADTWDASLLTLPEWQCRPHSADYIWRGPSQVRIWKEVDTVTREIKAWHAEWLRSIDRPIYMDGRPHPPEYAAHSWAGFSTGKWEGDMLTITTTHLKEGYIRRNGMPRSDMATLVEHWMRHGNFLTVVTIVTDPVYLTEPFVRSTDYELDTHQQIPPYPCEMVQEIERAKGVVPHRLPGANTMLNEFPERHHLPVEPARGGAETMYPEYRKKLSATKPVTPPAAAQKSGDGEVHVLPVQGNVYMLAGAGANITVESGKNGVVLLVDSGTAQMSGKVLAAIRTLTDKPVRKIINTSLDPDHTGGNETIASSGSTITGGNVAGDIADAAEGAAVVAHENVLLRMSKPPAAGQPAIPFRALPTETYHNEGLKLSEMFNGEVVEVFGQPSAHTDGDSLVYFRQSDVISTGDLFDTTAYPSIDLDRGGSIHGIIDGLNRILDLAAPSFRMEGGTRIIPGHGRLCDSADVAYYRDMVTVIRDRIQDMLKRGMTLEQVKAAKPTADYDPRYGSGDKFVEAIYKSLTFSR